VSLPSPQWKPDREPGLPPTGITPSPTPSVAAGPLSNDSGLSRLAVATSDGGRAPPIRQACLDREPGLPPNPLTWESFTSLTSPLVSGDPGSPPTDIIDGIALETSAEPKPCPSPAQAEPNIGGSVYFDEESGLWPEEDLDVALTTHDQGLCDHAPPPAPTPTPSPGPCQGPVGLYHCPALMKEMGRRRRPPTPL